MKERTTMSTGSQIARIVPGLMLLCATGCSTISHYADPYQWRKLNRGPDYGRDSYNFSIPEPQSQQSQVDESMPRTGVALDLPSSRSILPVNRMHD